MPYRGSHYDLEDRARPVGFDVPGLGAVIEPAADASVGYARVRFYPGLLL